MHFGTAFAVGESALAKMIGTIVASRYFAKSKISNILRDFHSFYGGRASALQGRAGLQPCKVKYLIFPKIFIPFMGVGQGFSPAGLLQGFSPAGLLQGFSPAGLLFPLFWGRFRKNQVSKQRLEFFGNYLFQCFHWWNHGSTRRGVDSVHIIGRREKTTNTPN